MILDCKNATKLNSVSDQTFTSSCCSTLCGSTSRCLFECCPLHLHQASKSLKGIFSWGRRWRTHAKTASPHSRCFLSASTTASTHRSAHQPSCRTASHSSQPCNDWNQRDDHRQVRFLLRDCKFSTLPSFHRVKQTFG